MYKFTVTVYKIPLAISEAFESKLVAEKVRVKKDVIFSCIKIGDFFWLRTTVIFDHISSKNTIFLDKFSLNPILHGLLKIR